MSHYRFPRNRNGMHVKKERQQSFLNPFCSQAAPEGPLKAVEAVYSCTACDVEGASSVP